MSETNSRYFTDGTGRAIFLSGSHTWNNLQDCGSSDPPPVFDYDTWLDFIEARNHNFFRLWVWEQTHNWIEDPGSAGYMQPHPWARTGPGNANDGKLKFDFDTFNQSYFDRMRQRIIKAGQRGMYVSVMLFQGWTVAYPHNGIQAANPGLHVPYNSSNNINGVDGDNNNDNNYQELHELAITDVTTRQEEYVAKVIDTVNDLHNVLYEISNESVGSTGNTNWQNHMIDFIHDYEASKPYQHPVGFTVPWPNGSNATLNASNAEWVSYNTADGGETDPPTMTGTKVSIWDSDHTTGISTEATFMWRAFTRGHNLLYMDQYDGSTGLIGGVDTRATSPEEYMRTAAGQCRTYANRVDLINMAPSNALASTGYCLAKTNAEYIVYRPSGSSDFTIDLSAASGTFTIEYFRPSTGATSSGGTTTGGATRTLSPGWTGEAVAYLYK